MNHSRSYPILEPLGIGELLDRAIRLYRRNFLQYIGIVAIVQVPLTLIDLISTYFLFTASSEMLYGETDLLNAFSTSSWITLATSILSIVLIQGVATATLTRSISDSYLGQPRDVISTLKSIGHLWPRIILALLGIGLLTIILLIWTIVPCVGWFTGVGLVFFVITVITPLITPIIVIEDKGANEAIRRAWELARRRFWWVLGFMLLLALFSQLTITVPATLVSLLFSSFTEGSTDLISTYSTTQLISETVIRLATSLIYIPFRLVAVTLLYFDIRIQTEGFDLSILAQQESNLEGDLQMEPAMAADLPSKKLITSNEIGYFVLVTIIAAVLYLVLILVMSLIGVASLGVMGGL